MSDQIGLGAQILNLVCLSMDQQGISDLQFDMPEFFYERFTLAINGQHIQSEALAKAYRSESLADQLGAGGHYDLGHAGSD